MCDSFCDRLEEGCDRISVYGGLALSIITHLLIYYGCWAANRLNIFYWFYEDQFHSQIIKGLPLSMWGIVHFTVFNFFVVMALVTHLRAYFADPGKIPTDVQVPDTVDTTRLNSCEKCSMKWKPPRAHHCKECGDCIFKVS